MTAASKYLIIICGPTASGKTSAALDLAEHYDTEILSTDSRQIYHELNIGTAKPALEELARVRHHFINAVSIQDEYSAGQFERDAIALLDQLFIKRDVVIAAGGTGLYIRAITEGFDDIPQGDPAIRDEIIREYETYGLEHLQQQAKSIDPVSYEATDIQNPQRLMRLIEVFRSTGKPRSAYLTGKKTAERRFSVIKIGLEVDREELYDRINRRVDEMMEKGLLDEVSLLSEHKSLNALQTVGYSELIAHLDGELSLDDAVSLIKRNTRRYAKRQVTWFRKDADIRWFDPNDTQSIISHIDETINT